MGKHVKTIEYSADVLRTSAVNLSEQGQNLVRMAKESQADAVVSFGSGTDKGRVRDHNEDSLFVAPPLFVVADGMGGHAAGEVASELAVQTISELAPKYPNAAMLGIAVESANEAVYKAASENARRAGMGTTVTAAVLKGTRLILAQVGDSRAYLLHNGTLQQLTRDHSYMTELIESGQLTPEEARIHPQRNLITRALGTAVRVKPDLFDLNVSAGDRLLLCSDGLSGMVDDDSLRSILQAHRDPQTCVNQLIYAANSNGGTDNITAIVVDVGSTSDVALQRGKRKSKLMALLIGLVAVVLILGAVAIIKALAGA